MVRKAIDCSMQIEYPVRKILDNIKSSIIFKVKILHADGVILLKTLSFINHLIFIKIVRSLLHFRFLKILFSRFLTVFGVNYSLIFFKILMKSLEILFFYSYIPNFIKINLSSIYMHWTDIL